MATQFESSVISYGSKADELPELSPAEFESSVISYGSKAFLSLRTSVCLV